jgi:AraC-like DNA-binding protein
MRRHNEFIDWSSDAIARIAIQMRELQEFTARTDQKMEDSQPMLHNQFLALFLQNNPQVIADLKAKKQDLLLQKSRFRDFLSDCLKKLHQFIQPIAPYAVHGVACQFHSFLMQFLTLKDFQAYHRTFERCDQLLLRIVDSSLEQFCVLAAPAAIRSVFSSPSLFTFPVHQLIRAAQVELPLETIAEIGASIQLLRDMFELEFGSQPTEAELIPLFNYVMLTSRVPNLYSLGRYIEQYLIDIQQADVELLDEKTRQCAKQFMVHVSQLDELLSEH